MPSARAIKTTMLKKGTCDFFKNPLTLPLGKRLYWL